MTFLCVHGFLGSSADWEGILPGSSLSICVDLFSNHPSKGLPKNPNLENLGKWVNDQASFLEKPRILIGYSLGGRIALHALATGPQIWDGAVIISAHPGLTNESDRKPRIQEDASWAERFAAPQSSSLPSENSWDAILSDWNSKSVFQGGSSEPIRKEINFNRELLAKIMMGCSLGYQRDFRAWLKTGLQIPLLWITGEKDLKFNLLAQEVGALNPLIQTIVVPGAGHRVLCDQPAALSKLIKNKFEGPDL